MDLECWVLNLLGETGAYLIRRGAASKEKPEQKLNQPKPGGHQTALIPQRGVVPKSTPVGCCLPLGLGLTPPKQDWLPGCQGSGTPALTLQFRWPVVTVLV